MHFLYFQFKIRFSFLFYFLFFKFTHLKISHIKRNRRELVCVVVVVNWIHKQCSGRNWNNYICWMVRLNSTSPYHYGCIHPTRFIFGIVWYGFLLHIFVVKLFFLFFMVIYCWCRRRRHHHRYTIVVSFSMFFRSRLFMLCYST